MTTTAAVLSFQDNNPETVTIRLPYKLMDAKNGKSYTYRGITVKTGVKYSYLTLRKDNDDQWATLLWILGARTAVSIRQHVEHDHGAREPLTMSEEHLLNGLGYLNKALFI